VSPKRMLWASVAVLSSSDTSPLLACAHFSAASTSAASDSSRPEELWVIGKICDPA